MVKREDYSTAIFAPDHFNIKIPYKTVHKGHKNHKCKSCGKSFSKAADLKRHIHTDHEGHKDHKCDSCVKLFTGA